MPMLFAAEPSTQPASLPKMLTRTPLDISAALAASRLPMEGPQMPRVGPRLTLRTSPLLHRMLTRRGTVAVAELRGRAQWRRRPDARESARETMLAILGGTSREPELERLARRYLIESKIVSALHWQPPNLAHSDARSSYNLQSALAAKRGVLLSVCHLGPYFDVASPLLSRGCEIYAVSGGWFFQKPSADLWGRRLAHWQRRAAARKEHALSARGSFPVVEALLSEGNVVESFFDVPGPHETHFLGKPVMLADGTARLAVSAGALVLVGAARRVGHRVWIDFAPALDARELDDADRLHERLAEVHEGFILPRAETLEDPRRDGFWEKGATTQSWVSEHHPGEDGRSTAAHARR